MKSDFLKKIIAATVITTSMGTLVPASVSAVDFYTWQETSLQSNGYWKESSGDWYFYNYSGVLQTGWIYDKGKWYYANSKGVMQTGVVQVEGKIYLLANDGVMQIGNSIINGKAYTFSQSGSAMGSNVPEPTKAYGLSGAPTLPYTPDQVVKNDDSSPDVPNTTARDPQNLVKYTVRFRDDDGDDLRTKSIEKGQEASLYTPTKKGYNFVEWNTKENGNGTSYDADEKLTVNHDINLYAQWEEVSSDSGNTSLGDKVLAEEIEISSSSSSITTKGGTLQMSAKVLPIDTSNKSVKWSVQDGTGKATISSSGLLTASVNGTVIVIATAADNSKVTGRYNVTISGQVDSGTTPDTGDNTGGNTGDNTGGNTGDNTGGDTTTGGKITGFDPTVKLDDVLINTAGKIVDLSLLKSSGKLPIKAKVTCNLDGQGAKEIEMPIKDWANGSPAFNGSIGTYVLTATLGDLPTGYTTSAELPKPTVKVIVSVAQSDERVEITGAASIADKTLATDQHIVSTSLLNKSGTLPSKVLLNYNNGGTVGTVEANVKSWSLDGAAETVFDSLTAGTTLNLKADIDIPSGYRITTPFDIKMKLIVSANQTQTVKELIRIVPSNEFILNYAIKEKLNYKGLAVEVKYNNDKTGTISYDKFADNGITTPGYWNGYELGNIGFSIPIALNGKTVLFTEKITVGQATSPTVKAANASMTTYDGSDGITNNYDIEYVYTLGTGALKASKVEKVYIDSVDINVLGLALGTDYKIDEINKKIIFTGDGLKKCFASLALRTPAIKTPFTSTIKVEFEPESGTEPITATASMGIHFIESKLAAPTGITLAAKADVMPKNDTIKVKGLISDVKYEYSITAGTTTTGWTSFTSTTGEQELTNVLFKDGNKLNIRIAQASDGKGAINPPSAAFVTTIASDNIAVAKSGENTITSFKLTDTVNSKDYIGTITQPTSATDKGKISIVVPEETNVSTLIASYVLSETDPTKGIVKVGVNIQTNGTTPNNFTGTVTYIVTAENDMTKTYEVIVTKPVLQKTMQRSGDFTYNVTTHDTTTGEDVVTSKTVTFVTEYGNSGIDIDNTVDGHLTITTGFGELDPTITTNTAKIESFNRIQQYTPKTSEMDSSYAYVGMIFTPSMGATQVKVADTFEGLKTATAISLNGTNMVSGMYLEQIPVARFGGGKWKVLPQAENIKHYQWINSSNQVIGYSSLTIKVQQ